MAGFISYQKKGDYEYASWCRAYRDPNEKSRSRSPKHHVIYLGRVIDKERGIYKSRERGYIMFDPQTQEIKDPPADFTPPQLSRKPRGGADEYPAGNELVLDFGDSYLVHSKLQEFGLLGILDELTLSNYDNAKALANFYVCSKEANSSAEDWLGGNFASYLYPQANFARKQMSETLDELGAEENYRSFFAKYLTLVKSFRTSQLAEGVSSASGSDNSKLPFTALWYLDDTCEEARVVCVADAATGLPLFVEYGGCGIGHTMASLRQYGLNPSNLIIDSGCATNADFKSYQQCNIDFVTRIGCDRTCFKEAVEAHGSAMNDSSYLVKWGDSVLYAKRIKTEVMLNEASGETCSGYGYLCRDTVRHIEEQKQLYDQYGRGEISKEALFAALKTTGMFMLFSSAPLEVKELLSCYSQRQSIEQVFERAKKEHSLLLGWTQTERTFRGHLLLSFISSVILRLLQLDLRGPPYNPRSALLNLRQQKIKVSASGGNAVQQVNDVYKAAKVKGPEGLLLTLDSARPFL